VGVAGWHRRSNEIDSAIASTWYQRITSLGQTIPDSSPGSKAGYHLGGTAAKIDLVIEQLIGTRATVDRRGLIFKAIAGLIGGAIGWLPVELASSGHSLT